MSMPIVLPDSQEMPRKRWTRDECRRLMNLGLLEGGKYELIEGEIIPKVGQNELHIFVLMQVLLKLIEIFGRDYVRPPAPIAISDYNEPEPDVSGVARPLREYLDAGTPEPQDVRLLVEVSDSTLRGDISVKAALYGRAGIPEYWVVNINARAVEVFRQPTAEGYASVATVTGNEAIRPLAAPEAEVHVADLLP